MSATLDYGCQRFSIKEPMMRSKDKCKHLRYEQNRRRRVSQFFRDFPYCYYCGVLLDKENRSLDHYIPRSKGGFAVLKNLVTSCKTCNVLKGNQMPPCGLNPTLQRTARAWKLFPCY